jgi:hypothetical protein
MPSRLHLNSPIFLLLQLVAGIGESKAGGCLTGRFFIFLQTNEEKHF